MAGETLDVFDLRRQVIDDYRTFIRSFLAIDDERVRNVIDEALDAGRFWPDPWVAVNPNFAPGGHVDDLVQQGVLHPEAARIFRAGKTEANPVGQGLRLYRHQVEAIETARRGENYTLTTGTGSGKSLSYIVPIVDHVLRTGRTGKVQAVIVYPMNALANSQWEELSKFLSVGYPEGQEPVTFARYTGQEDDAERERILRDPPDILLTNYVMLELILTRVFERQLVGAMEGLKFLVLDELHTYRGRAGADVALLIRRLRDAVKAQELQCVGTSATLASGGSLADQRAEVAKVASLLFGAPVLPTGVIGETLERLSPPIDFQGAALDALRTEVSSVPTWPDAATFTASPLASWLESTFGMTEREEKIGRAHV